MTPVPKPTIHGPYGWPDPWASGWRSYGSSLTGRPYTIRVVRRITGLWAVIDRPGQRYGFSALLSFR